ncbi:apolipoprotein N-acyltransferase [Nitratireductor sp. GISD-1A_MAKvit]|uniref:apolipoprotein N-acyltransferase n=1 Tax=Nitratireductor sp. GISD-1A_MAKvit TaxID=3234198 RepID=UPI003465D384
MESLAGRVILLYGWRRSLAAFLAGGVAAFAQPPFDFFAACFVAFPVLVWLLDGAVSEGHGPAARMLPAFKTGWWFGFGYFLVGLWWIGNALLVDAGNFAWALPLALVGLPACLAVFYGIAALLARLFWFDGVFRIIALALAFGMAEWMRATLFTGFPWNAIGYAAMPTLTAMQAAGIVGLFGMNILAVFGFSVPALLGTRRHLVAGFLAALVLVGTQLGFGLIALSSTADDGTSLQVRIVQPSITQTEKWDEAEQNRIFDTLLELTARPADGVVGKPSLIVWPETAVPFLFTDRPDALARLGEVLDEGQVLVTGAVRAERGEGLAATRYYNSVMVIADDGSIMDAVDKSHLVPFGEYVPFSGVLKALGVEQIVQSAGPFTAGGQRRPIEVASGINALPFICYEVIFPQLVSGSAEQADFLLNVTNDAWFGFSPGPYQHFRQARLRAIENRVPLVRAANSGISAVVDSSGRVIDAFDLSVVGNLDVNLPISSNKKYYFTDAGTNGLFVALVFGAMLLGAPLIGRLRAN